MQTLAMGSITASLNGFIFMSRMMERNMRTSHAMTKAMMTSMGLRRPDSVSEVSAPLTAPPAAVVAKPVRVTKPAAKNPPRRKATRRAGSD